MTLLATIDRMAEEMEHGGHEALAAVLDTVSEQLDERGCEAEDEDEDALATASVTAAGDATDVLKRNAERVYDAVKQYGAKSYRVDASGVQIVLDRGNVETETAFGFYSQDQTGKPQLRVTFTCGGDKMVRWASLDSITGEAIVQATQHVFGTGENYGAQVVTAATQRKRVSASVQLVDAIEQRVHDACLAYTVVNTNRALRPFSKRLLRKAVPLLDAWTARHVQRYLRAS